jgi:hypothetical protein
VANPSNDDRIVGLALDTYRRRSTITPLVTLGTLPLLNPRTFTAMFGPSVFGRNLQCELVRKVDTREECHWSHACSLQASRRGNQWHPRV